MTTPSPVRQEVNKLLGMYEAYKNCSDEQALAARKLAQAKLRGGPVDDAEKIYESITQKMQSISDDMTFASPLIWALYKYEAYADEAQPVRTMQDFRVHCSKPGYICTKRFMFVNKALSERHLPTLSNTTTYPDNNLLSKAFDVLHLLSQNQAFMQTWRMHEYYKRDGMVAKWDNFAE